MPMGKATTGRAMRAIYWTSCSPVAPRASRRPSGSRRWGTGGRSPGGGETRGEAAARLSAAERVAALGDVDALTGMGEIKSGESLALAVAFANDPVRQVVDSTIGIIAGVHDYMLPKELRPNYARLVDRAFGARARQLGWKAKAGEGAETRLTRSSIVPLVALWGVDGSLAAEARQLAGQWLTDRTAVDPDIVGALLNVAARTGDEAFLDR